MSVYVELFMDQGSDFSTTINIADENTGLPQNVSGMLVESSVKKSILSQNVVTNFVCTVTNEADGDIVISLDSANTALINPGTYVFDVRTYLRGTTKRLLEGLIIVSPAITKD